MLCLLRAGFVQLVRMNSRSIRFPLFAVHVPMASPKVYMCVPNQFLENHVKLDHLLICHSFFAQHVPLEMLVSCMYLWQLPPIVQAQLIAVAALLIYTIKTMSSANDSYFEDEEHRSDYSLGCTESALA